MHAFQRQEPSSDRILAEHLSESVSLLNSRMRAQQDQDLDSEENERAVQEFRREIEQKFKMSVANKLFTFPRIIRSIEDIISSDESQGEEEVQQFNKAPSDQFEKNKASERNQYRPYDKAPEQQEFNFQFEKKFKTKKTDYSDFPIKNERLKTEMKQTEINFRKNKNSARNKNDSKSHLPNMKKKKIERMKTQLDCSSSYLDTMRSKNNASTLKRHANAH